MHTCGDSGNTSGDSGNISGDSGNTSTDESPTQMQTCGDSASTSGDSEAAKVVTDFCSLLATALSKVSLPDNAAPN